MLLSVLNRVSISSKLGAENPKRLMFKKLKYVGRRNDLEPSFPFLRIIPI